MEYLKDGTFDTKFLVTHRVKLEDFPELYNAFDKRYAGKLSLLLPESRLKFLQALTRSSWKRASGKHAHSESKEPKLTPQ